MWAALRTFRWRNCRSVCLRCQEQAVLVIMVCGRPAARAWHCLVCPHDKAQTLAGGLAAWREASMPVEKA